MEYVRLGATGVMVSPLCLGTMMFGKWGNPDHEQGIEVIRAALDAGINFVDTADIYSDGECEEIVGKAIKRPQPRRHRARHEVLQPDGRGPQRPWNLS
jgi:aryl-alcohol dehydrogenase-like predicted oxidoreductase